MRRIKSKGPPLKLQGLRVVDLPDRSIAIQIDLGSRTILGQMNDEMVAMLAQQCLSALSEKLGEEAAQKLWGLVCDRLAEVSQKPTPARPMRALGGRPRRLTRAR